MQPERDYPVGYKKPPKHTQFPKGQSGNLAGRPRGSKNLATLVGKALDAKIVITDGDGRRKITKREAIITQLVNRSAKADLRATQILLGLMQDIERRSEANPSATNTFSAEDQQVLKLLKARLAGPNNRDNPNNGDTDEQC